MHKDRITELENALRQHKIDREFIIEGNEKLRKRLEHQELMFEKFGEQQKKEQFHLAVKLLRALKKIDSSEGLTHEENMNLLRNELFN